MNAPYVIAVLVFLASACLATAETTTRVNLSAETSNRVDVGSFQAGSTLFISVTGTALISWEYLCNPDGSLAAPLAQQDTARRHASVDSRNYPTNFGGDGINHFLGGGVNFVPGHGDLSWPTAGKETTDTKDPAVIRFGAVVGTFADSPEREDWFLVGRNTRVTVPRGGRHLYLVVNDSAYGDNAGGYWVVVRERPSRLWYWIALVLIIGSALVWLWLRACSRSELSRSSQPASEGSGC